MTTLRDTRQPLLWVLSGSVCISFAPIFIRLANVSPDSAGFYRMLFAGIALSLLLRLKRERFAFPRRTLLLLVGSGLFLSVDFMCWHRSIHYVGPGFSTLLGNFQVFFTALLGTLLFREKLSRSFLVAVVTAMAGLLLITGLRLETLDPGYRLGVILGLSTAACYSGYILMMKRAMHDQQLSGVAAMLIVALTCTVTLGLVTPATGASFAIPDVTSLLALAGAGVICTTLGWSLISSALKYTSATAASLCLLLQPALAFCWDVLFFARPTTGQEAAGVLLILSAIYLGTLRPANRREEGANG